MALPAPNISVPNVRRLLNHFGLPAGLPINVLSQVPGENAKYDPGTDEITLYPGATCYSVLHEGAHAEHHRKLNSQSSLTRWSPVQVFTVLLASEAYVGARLASVPGFVECERKQNLRFASAENVCTQFTDARKFDALNPHNGRPVGPMFLLKLLPLVAAEQTLVDLQFASGIGLSRQGVPGLMRWIYSEAYNLAQMNEQQCLNFASVLDGELARLRIQARGW